MSTPDQMRKSPQMLQRGQTLEELENQMLPHTVSRPVTAEELERAMRGEGPPPVSQQPPRFPGPQYGSPQQVPMQVPTFVRFNCVFLLLRLTKLTERF